MTLPEDLGLGFRTGCILPHFPYAPGMKIIPLIACGAAAVVAPFASAEVLASYVTQGVSGNAAQ